MTAIIIMMIRLVIDNKNSYGDYKDSNNIDDNNNHIKNSNKNDNYNNNNDK